MTTVELASPKGGFGYRHPRARLVALLGAPMSWLIVIYLGSLAALADYLITRSEAPTMP